MAHQRVLKEMREDCECQRGKYCPLEALLESMSDRVLEQHKLVEVFKYIKGERLGRDISWNKAYMLWVEEGYAKRFAEVYSDEKTFRQMKKELFNT